MPALAIKADARRRGSLIVLGALLMPIFFAFLGLALATVPFLLGDREMGWGPLSVISGWLPNFVLAGLLFFAGLALVWLTRRGLQPKTEASERYLAMLSRLRESSEWERADELRTQIPVETLTH